MTAVKKFEPPANELRAHGSIKHHQFTASSRNKRVIAFLLDSVIGTAAMTLVSLAFKSITPQHADTLARLALVLFYYVLPTYASGQTLGKKLMGLYVVRFSDEKELGIGQVILRETLGKTISWLCLGLGFIWVSFNKKRRAWHDLMANTWVVEK